MPVLEEVAGRLEDVVTGPDGRQLVRFHGVFVDLPGVVEGQVVQKSRRDFVVRAVPSVRWTSETERGIIERMHQRLGDMASITVEQVVSIPRSASGKFQAVISEAEK